MLSFGQLPVPWNALWSAEAKYEIRPCRWAGGRLAIWSPHAQGEGHPIFAKPHSVRQRQSVVRYLCTVCGNPTPASDRWWFGHGEYRDGMFMTGEAPVHRACARVALEKCPHLRALSAVATPFPKPHAITYAIVGGSATDEDFGVRIAGRTVVGSLKFAWPESAIHVRR